MVVSKLQGSAESTIFPIYYKVYNEIIPKIYDIISKFWNQLSGWAYSTVTASIGLVAPIWSAVTSHTTLMTTRGSPHRQRKQRRGPSSPRSTSVMSITPDQCLHLTIPRSWIMVTDRFPPNCAIFCSPTGIWQRRVKCSLLLRQSGGDKATALLHQTSDPPFQHTICHRIIADMRH